MNIKEIESAITQLPPTDLMELAVWFEEFHGRIWDDQLTDDIEAGRLDTLIKQAKREYERGDCKPL